MNSRQGSARDIFLAAREIPPGPERRAYLQHACGANDALRSRVEALLRADESAGSFLKQPTADMETRGGDAGSAPTRISGSLPGLTESAGETIGRYKLLQQIGEGGFGVVYMAEQREPVKRRVALKIIKLGMDTQQVIARFESERQALALMDHPNIAKVFDAGSTEAGRPFFVMEYIQGAPIVEYCDREHLETKQRLELFTKVCRAIQHAHQKGIIHRDIKPSNVLITLEDGAPVPKVIDFGIAKATSAELTTQSLFTEHRQLIGTPAYMSPEQAEMTGLDIDTRSDIYSLGVLLYELLTGAPPFDTRELASRGFAEMMRIIRSVEPRRPSTRVSTLGRTDTSAAQTGRVIDPRRLSQTLRGDLDWIVMKCLEKDRARRYETASGLAVDIQRYLNHEPVSAAPPSAIYRLRKFIRHNRGPVAAVSSVALALIIGVIGFAWQAKIARDQRDLAFTAGEAARKAQNRAEQELRRSELLVYSGRLTLAQSDFEGGNGALTLHYLNQCREEFRGWEWRYLWNRCNAELALVGHLAGVAGVAVSPDGRRIVTGSGDGMMKLWDAGTGKELFSYYANMGMVMSVAWSPDGTRIAIGGGPWGKHLGEVELFDAETGQVLHEMKDLPDCVWSIAFSPDSQRLVSGGGDWSYGPGYAKVWSAATGQEILSLPKHTNRVMAVAVSPDGQTIATAGADSKVFLWDAGSGQAIREIKYNGGVWAVAFSPDGKRIAAGSSDTTARVWDVGTAQELVTLHGHADWLRSIAFSPDGKRLVTGSADMTTRVWDAATGLAVFSLKNHSGIVRSAIFTPDGRHIVTGCEDKTAKVWDAERGQEVPVLKAHVDYSSRIVGFSPDGRFLVTGSVDGTVIIWEVATCRKVLSLKAPPPADDSRIAILSAAFSPDGRRIVTSSFDKTARVWDIDSRQMVLVLEHSDTVSSATFSPDGTRILTASGGSGKPGTEPVGGNVWDSTTGQRLLTLHHPGGSGTGIFSPDGTRILTAGDDMVRTWDAATGKESFSLNGHTRQIWSAAFSPDGRRIVTGSLDGTAKIWDAATGRELLTLVGHTEGVRSVTYSPDGSRIVTGSDDRSAKIWDPVTGQELLGLKGHPAEIYAVAFSPDGRTLATVDARNQAIVRVWYAADLPTAAVGDRSPGPRTGGSGPKNPRP